MKKRRIHKARSIYEEQMGKTVSLRQLSELLTHEGLPVHYSTVSRMEDALKYLYPWIPDLLESGLGRPQITALLALRHDAERVWDEFCLISDTGDKSFSDVFGQCCGRFNSPELWSLEMFRDELIGDLLHALPHPELDYDRWMMELDLKNVTADITSAIQNRCPSLPQTASSPLTLQVRPHRRRSLLRSCSLSPVHVVKSQESR